MEPDTRDGRRLGDLGYPGATQTRAVRKRGTIHTTDCVDQTLAYALAIVAFDEAYPRHCTSCRGWGGSVIYDDPSPPGVSLSPGYLLDVDPCPHCAAADPPRCSLCATPLDDNFERVCDCPQNTGLPPSPECWCWEEA